MAYVDVPKVDESTTQSEILEFLNDIRSRKEFNQLDYSERSEVKTYISEFLRLHGPQIFVQNFVNDNTPYKRLFINWQTGTGKTLAALTIAREFASVHRRKKIFIVGFTKQLFINELLTHPEFGFISREELKTLRQLRKNAEFQGIKSSAYKKLTDFITQLKRRLTESSYHKFYGYKELSNRLFQPTAKAIINNFNFKDLFKTSVIKRDRFLEVLEEEIQRGNIVINEDLLNNMRGSLLIADEIHNLYNMETENNYGVAIQYILDILGKDAPYTVFMSATPMTGAATEIIDLLNLLIRLDYLPNKKHLRKEDFFDSSKEESVLKPGALERIGMISAGRTSFLMDLGKASYPKRIFVGTKISDIPYLHFTECPMSEYQISQVESDKIPCTSGPANFIYDFAFPDPDDSECCIYNPQDFKNKMNNASESWKEKMGIQVLDDGGEIVISGMILHQSTLQKYSNKYFTMLNMVLDLMKSKDSGKILIYHHMVHSTGVLFIQEVFRMNGFIDDISNSTNDTICNICTITKKEHDDEALGHSYVPARFMTIHSGIERNLIMNNIEKFNALNNLDGNRYRILIGSKIIREGYNFKAVRHQIIMSLPNDIPSLIQVFGRVVRRGSHFDLPEEKRKVEITVLVSTQPNDDKSELCRYRKKIKEYLVIQEIERVLRKYAVDSFLSYDALKSAFPEIETTSTLDVLPYRPVIESVFQPPTKKLTYIAYGFAKKEIDIIMNIIWIIMSIQPVWTYNMLFEAVQGKHSEVIGHIPRFGYKSLAFDRSEFDLALHYLTGKTNTLGTKNIFTIIFAEPYYVLCPMTGIGKPLAVPEIYLRMSYTTKEVSTKVYIDVTSSEVTADLSEIEFAFNNNVYPELALLEFPQDIHFQLLKKLIIEGYNGNIYNKNAYNIYTRFKILVTIKDILGVDAVIKSLSNISDLKKKDKDTAIGFLDISSVKIWDGSSFSDFPLYYFTIQGKTENTVVIGFTKQSRGKIEFMIRPPLHNYDDKRLVPKGAVCMTRLKEDIAKHIKQLVPYCSKCKPWLKKNFEINKVRTEELCKKIKLMLLSLEEESRSKNSKTIWLYLFNQQV